jgi:hypothetical protein
MALSALESKRASSLKEKIFNTDSESSESMENKPLPAEGENNPK